jgi:hypothetical protein
VITNATFDSNSAGDSGGGMFNNNTSSPVITNATFSGNSAVKSGGGLFNDDASSPSLTNVSLANNSAGDSGGGISNFTGSEPQVRNTILWGNTAGEGTQMYNFASTPTVSDSVVQDGYSEGTNILTGDPNLGPLGKNGGATSTLPLLEHSSAIDTGNDAVCPATDQRQAARPHGARCDIGAYEYIDTTPPVVGSFLAVSPSNNPDIQISAFDVTDDVNVTGYMITESDIPPLPGAAGWSLLPPDTFTVAADGFYGLYPWAKDASGNVSAAATTPRVVLVDTTLPVVTAFTAPSPSNSLAINITAFAASDAMGVTGYMITTSAAQPLASDSGWTSAPPTAYTVLADGTYTLYPWAKDGTGNVSIVFGTPQEVLVDTIAPVVDTFTAPGVSNSLTINSIVFAASDGVGVIGYTITRSDTPPLAGGVGWSGTPPTSITVPADGTYTLYPWAKDGTGNISALFSTPQEVQVDTILPVVDAFSATSPSGSLNIAIPVFSATDSVSVTGYMITTSAAQPSSGDAGWRSAAQSLFTAPVDGTYTLYPWAKDGAGNVSAVFGSPQVVIVDTTAPVVNGFSATSPSNSLSIPIPVFSATDAVNVSGYMITTSAVRPMYWDTGWSSSAPASFSVSADGTYTLYPWAKDEARNVSEVFGSPRVVVVDTTAPSVLSILRSDPNPTSLGTVHYTVSFSESVTGVKTSDFLLTASGVIGASITDVSGSGSLYTVTVDTGAGNGTLRLDIPAGATLADLAGNPLSNLPFTGGETYTIRKWYFLFLPIVEK